MAKVISVSDAEEALINEILYEKLDDWLEIIQEHENPEVSRDVHIIQRFLDRLERKSKEQ